MKRKRKADTWLDQLFNAPWWVGVAGAGGVIIFVWGLLDYLHLPGWHTNLFIGVLDSAIHQNAVRHLSWIIVAILLSGSAGSYFRRRERAQMLDRQRSLDSLRSLTWQQFERLVAEAYSRYGYRVTENGQGGADGGVDLFLSKDGKKWIVQCKRWRTSRVGAPVVREMYGLMQHYGAVGAKVVCVGGFTRDAIAFATGKPIQLIGGSKLLQLVDGVRNGYRTAATSPKSPSHNETITELGVLCPTCGGAMVKRRKSQSHSLFWGCTAFPRCTGMRPLRAH